MASENEAIADIVAEWRDCIESADPSVWNDERIAGLVKTTKAQQLAYLDRIEAAWKRERAEIEDIAKSKMLDGATIVDNRSVGNAAAMREALEMARDTLKSAEKYVYGNPPNGGAIGWDDVWPSEWHNALEAVERALAAPARNCDMPHANDHELWLRWQNYCAEIWPRSISFSSWLIAPAERKGGRYVR